MADEPSTNESLRLADFDPPIGWEWVDWTTERELNSDSMVLKVRGRRVLTDDLGYFTAMVHKDQLEDAQFWHHVVRECNAEWLKL